MYMPPILYVFFNKNVKKMNKVIYYIYILRLYLSFHFAPLVSDGLKFHKRWSFYSRVDDLFNFIILFHQLVRNTLFLLVFL